MVDLRTLSDILENEKSDGSKRVRVFLRELENEPRRMRLLLAKQTDTLLHPELREVYKWLGENLPRLEEAITEDKTRLKSLGRILTKDKKPLFFDALYYCVSTNPCLTEEDIDGIFRVCNSFDGGISLGDAQSLPILLRLCVCVRICRTFSKLLAERESDVGTEHIRELFLTLDELYLFDGERALSHNETEKLLCRDPAGIYPRLTGKTRASYRKNLVRLARERGTSEKALAELTVKECGEREGSGRHVGRLLCDRPEHGKTYLFLVFFLTGIFMLLLCLVSPVFLVSFFPVYSAGRLIADKLFLRLVKGDFYLPRLSLSSVPEKNGVMAVITTLLTGTKEDEKLCDRLEEMYFSNGGENVYFGLLCDLCDSEEKETTQDSVTIDEVSQRIRELRRKYGNVFFLFVREREYSYSEEKYIAPERKRGAVNALAEFLCGMDDAFSYGSIKPEKEVCENIKYVLTLDSDTNPAFDCIKELVGIMMHPQNAPVWDKKMAVVTKGYGILQPAVSPALDSSRRSFFSAILGGHGGIDMYSSGGTDFNMSLFGRGIFCGKGMFEKRCFYDLLCGENAFAGESVLSHDAPEGARLRCAFVPDIEFTDTFPSQALSYYKRQHRWIRGDFQNLPFLCPEVKTAGGRKIKNHIDASSRLFMWENVSGALVPVCSLIMLLLSCFFDDGIRALLVSVSLAPYVITFVNSFLGASKKALPANFRRSFYSPFVYSGLWSSFIKMLFRICAMPQSAYVCLDAAVRCVYRMNFSRRKMLEWTTAAQNDAEKRDGLLGYIKKLLFNAVCGTALFVCAPSGIVRFIGLMWLFMPVFAYHSGKTVKRGKTNPSEKEKKRLMTYCEDMWHFFSENVTPVTNHLPADNVSLYPERKLSRMTSPTNIGFYLLSLVCSHKTGFIDRNELLQRLSDTLCAVDKLEKYRGLLYNWYDVFRAEPMEPKYISSVDLGNLIACLICVKEALSEMCEDSPESKRAAELCEKLINGMDISVLYDEGKRLFYIGGVYDGREFIPDKNRYDMLMSEARILSFCAVALKRVGKEHLSYLSRRLVKGDGYMGLASWSGTVFEFFMPEIFMPSKKGSLIYEGLCFAYSAIKKKTAKGKHGTVFGISESCYNELDSSSNYKYRAFGVQRIAVNVIDERRVISPYSSFLCLPMSKRNVLSNLERLKCMGAYGEYGFFESVDFDNPCDAKEYAVVKCFMAHHIGMSMASAVNLLCGGAVSQWFMKDKRVRSALCLNDEKIPYDVYVRNPSRRHHKTGKAGRVPGRDTVYHKRNVVKLDVGSLAVIAKRGRLTVKTKELLALRKKMFSDSLGSLKAFALVDGDTLLFDKACSLKTDGGQIVYSKGFVCEGGAAYDGALCITVGTNTSDTLRIRIRLRRRSGKEIKTARLGISFYPLLDTKENGEVCSFFDAGDIVIEPVNDGEEMYFSRISSGKCIYAGASRGYDKRAFADGERVTLECKSLLHDSVFEAEFVLSFSQSRICAQTGLVRCRQDSFEEVCDAVKELSQKRERETFRERPERRSDVLGCSVVKNAHVSLPLNSTEKSLFLLASKNFCALCDRDNLGISFKGDINKGRVTSFSGVNGGFSDGERLLCGNADLCRVSKQAVLEDGTVCYRGNLDGNDYSVKVFVCRNMPCKIVTVKMHAHQNVRLEIVPSKNCDGIRFVGSGIAFFSGGEGRESGFVYGFCEKQGEEIGARYVHSGGISAVFEPVGGYAEYTFCIGKASEREAFEICSRIREEKHSLFDEAQSLYTSLVFDEKSMEEDLKSTLGKYFVFPESRTSVRIFAGTSDALYLFDTLLMMYSSFEAKREYVIKAFGVKAGTGIEKYLLCLILSEYVRISGDKEIAEFKVGGDTLYKRCLVYLFADTERTEIRELHLISLRYFASLCEEMGDVRTCLELVEKSRKMNEKRNGGIFL